MMTPEGKAPACGQLHRNRDLATTFRTLAEKGAAKGVCAAMGRPTGSM